MSFLDILYTVFIMPLRLIFENLYMIAYQVIGDPGWSIIVLSLMVNFLVLPLYIRADAIQAEQRDVENKLAAGVAHIKKTFKGNEKQLMMQTYYRQNNYKPTDVFKGSVSLFLQIPFFMAAFTFLSELDLLRGVTFLGIPDLGAPDGLITLGALSINFLPFLMTGINLVSCVLFTRGMPAKSKAQLYGMAMFFLIFLYNSPAGLVFYWTLNNVFSLCKTIVYRIKPPKRAGKTVKSFAIKPNKKRYVYGVLFLAALTGFLIPSAVIAASPMEFVVVTDYLNPLWYMVSAVLLALGMFLVWFSVFYWLCNQKAKVIFELVVWILCGVALVNYMFFDVDLGNLSNALQYANPMTYDFSIVLINAACAAGVAVAFGLAFKYLQKIPVLVLPVALIAVLGMSCINAGKVAFMSDEMKNNATNAVSSQANFTLSTTGNNVVVLMLDRALGEYIPYIMNEKPELMEQFSGFTYYSNVISFGSFTNTATPALFGGYEYTPAEINKRDTELLVDKQNEALSVMPVIFSEANYDVTVCDPPYAGYTWIPDLSIYDGYENIDAYITKGNFTSQAVAEQFIANSKRNFFCYGLMKCMPLAVQGALYNDGSYNNSNTLSIGSQVISDNMYEASGLKSSFLNGYSVLENLSGITTITDEPSNSFLMMANDTTHEPMLMQTPDYTPESVIDNTDYETANADRFTINGETLIMETADQMAHYHTNMAALLQVGAWLDYLKECGVYENTRIIIVSDHGSSMRQLDDMTLDENSDGRYNMEFYYPLLLVKDFGDGEFTTSDEFMTNADVATLATQNLIANATNPFTGVTISNAEKYAHPQYVYSSYSWDTGENNGTTFIADGVWFAVQENMRSMSNWTEVEDPNLS